MWANSCRNTQRSSSSEKLPASPTGSNRRGRTNPKSDGLPTSALSTNVTGARTPISCLQSSSKFISGASTKGRCAVTRLAIRQWLIARYVLRDPAPANHSMRGQETTHPNLGAAAAGLTSSPSPELSSLPTGAGDTRDAGVARAPAIGVEIRFMKLNRLIGEGTVQGKASRITTNSQSP